MRVLITNLLLWPRSGTVTFVRDLALGLLDRGLEPAVFSLDVGPVCGELRAAGVPVVRRLRALPWRPDVIHGHHGDLLRIALHVFPRVPAINVCHGHLSTYDGAVLHPSVRRYFAVSDLCLRRLLADGVPPADATLLPNFVDLRRFTPRAALPRQPRRALLFSNYATEGAQLQVVRDACARAGLALDVVGSGVGTAVDRPEDVLPRYDVVFAKARAALEAMTVGAAVVLCDYGALGPLVRSADFEVLQRQNFGREAIAAPLTVEGLLHELARYDPDDVVRVRELVMTRASSTCVVDRLIATYATCISEGAPPCVSSLADRLDVAHARAAFALYWSWLAQPPGRRARLSALGVTAPGRAWLSRVFGPRSGADPPARP